MVLKNVGQENRAFQKELLDWYDKKRIYSGEELAASMLFGW